MITKFLLTAETGNKVGDTVAFRAEGIRGMYAAAQVALGGGTATVTLQGRISDKFAWKTLNSFTQDDALEIVVFPEMRGEITGYSSGTISLAIVGGS